MTARTRLAIAAVLLAAAASSSLAILVDAWWPGFGVPDRYALAVACWVSVLAGLVARARRPDNPIGLWLVISGLLAPAGWMVGGDSPLLIVVSGVAFAASAAAGSVIPITFPSGKLDGRAGAAVILVAATCLVYRVQQVLTVDPVPVHLDAGLAGGVVVAMALYGYGFLLAFGFWLARRWWRLTGPARRSIAPVLVGALFFVATSVVQGLAQSLGAGGDALSIVDFVHTLSFSAVPVGLMAGVLRVQMARSAVAGLVVELGETPEPAELRRALATALGDPSLEVLLFDEDSGGFVDPAGGPVGSPADVAGSRAVTLLEREGAPLAAILHDPALLDDPGLVASVATAVRLTVENDRLQAEVREQLAEVKASRARIVEATDAERRRVERDIHDGAQQRLVALSLAIGRARSQLGSESSQELETTLAEAADEVHAALAELRELARGIHPAILTQAGLEPAVRSLVDRTAVTTSLDFAVTGRLPEQIEAAAYFVVSEALTNVVKHAGAASARVSLRSQGGTLVVEVGDCGRGGADPSAGTGLRGLRDRVEALGGSLDTASPAGGGTVVRATLPCDGARP